MDRPIRKHLSISALVGKIRSQWVKKRQDLPKRSSKSSISTVDCLLSALAMFQFKWPSMLKYDENRRLPTMQRNFDTLYGVKQAPSDTYMRERLDPVKPCFLRKAFNIVFTELQRGKVLEQFSYLKEGYLLSLDGTGQFSSNHVNCSDCCEKHHRNGKITYYHQLLGAALVSPEQKAVIPLAPEAILKQDGSKKNDCERNASKRLLESIRREHPHLPLVIVEDGLASNGPHIKLLQSLSMRFILGAKPGDHPYLFDWVANSVCEELTSTDDDGATHHFKFINNVPLNDKHFDCQVNFLEYREVNKKGQVKQFSWVTDIKLTENNVFKIMRAGRSRWRIENETFNTLKNQGYELEHNYGHGHQHLATVLAMLMMLSFLIDQVQYICSATFRQAKKMAGRWTLFWAEMQVLFKRMVLTSFEALIDMIAQADKSLTDVVFENSS